MGFGIKNKKGFASFELVWSSLLFVMVIMASFYFFKILHISHKTLIAAQYTAFSSVWKSFGGTNSQNGLIYKEEVLSNGDCSGECREYTAISTKISLGFGMDDYQARQSVFIILDDNI